MGIFISLNKCRPLIAVGILLFTHVAFSASLIDARFRLSRAVHEPKAQHKVDQGNVLTQLYTDFFAASMYSKCRWIPSDSEYQLIAARRCGQVGGTWLAISRFLNEADAHRHSKSLVNDRGQLRVVHFEDSCDLL